MEDELLEALENLKGRTIVDVVTGDMEGENSFSQLAILRLDNNKQFAIQSQALSKNGQQLSPAPEGYSGLSGAYDDLDEFWQEVDDERGKE